MSSETITRNDLKAVLNEVLPSEPVSYVIESGYSGRWFYKKWSDGSADCWCYTASESIACTSQWGSVYYSAQKTYSLPTGLFIPYPVITATLYDGGGLGWVTIATWSESSVTVYVSEPTSTTRSMEICFHVYGKWK